MRTRVALAAFAAVALLLPLSAVASAETSLAALGGAGRVAPAAPAVGLASPALPGVPAAVLAVPARSGETAAGLAQRLGMTYEDGGTYVLLSDSACRVRVYPNTHMISLDGQDQVLRGSMQRGPAGVLVPGPAVGLIEAHVLGARTRRLALSAPPPPPPPAVPALSALKPLVLPKALPPRAAVPAAASGSVTPDPGWVVAPTGRAWRWIVLHHSDDTSGCLSKYHQVHLDKGWEHGCGYHFVIGNGSQSADGAVEVSNRWREQLQGAHAKTPDNLFNEHGIGICLVGNFEVGTDRPTAAQMRSLARLVQYLIDRYDIRPSNVLGHGQCKATACPGRNFPWAELRAQLRPARRAAPLAASAPLALSGVGAPASTAPSALRAAPAPTAAPRPGTGAPPSAALGLPPADAARLR